MKALIRLTAVAAAFSLAACGDNNGEEKKADDMAPPEATTEAPATGELDANETMERVAEAVKLDTSSFENFKESIANMKESLTTEDSARLTTAFSNLATRVSETGEDMTETGKNMVENMDEGKSVTEILYERFAEELDGKTFEEVLSLADRMEAADENE